MNEQPMIAPEGDDEIELESLTQYIEVINLAEYISEEYLKEIGNEVRAGFDSDLASRSSWEKEYEDYLELATLVVKTKTFPWPKASNVKYPLLATAALQFAARAYQILLPNKSVVKAGIIGNASSIPVAAPPQQQSPMPLQGAAPQQQQQQPPAPTPAPPIPVNPKLDKAKRVSQYMSYQLLEEMTEWEENMDRLLLALPIIGNMFKKTYQDARKGAVSELVMPSDLVVNYTAKSLEDAPRKTHILPLYSNDVLTKIRSGEWLDHEFEQHKGTSKELVERGIRNVKKETTGITPASSDSSDLLVYLEQHTFSDLDGDGYEEPYIITIAAATNEVVGINARFDIKGIEQNEDTGEIVHVEAVEYFTNFIFIPNPVSGIYGLGFGKLLGPLNKAVNSLINQLIDAGTLNNLSSGFIAKGIRLQPGNNPLKPGEWRPVQTSGPDLKSGIVPIPVNPPSQILYQLLGFMVEAGFTLGAVNDIMQGKNPGQNQPFSTTSEVLKQGLQVFSSIHKRIYRALYKEFKKIFRLNYLYLDSEKYFTVLDPDPEEETTKSIGKEDFDSASYDIRPGADPNQGFTAEKMEEAQIYAGFMQLGTINKQVGTRRILEARGVEGIKELMTIPPPVPSFAEKIEMKKLELQEKELDITKFETKYQALKDQTGAQLNLAKAQTEAMSAQTGQMTLKFDLMMKQIDMQMQRIDVVMKQMDVYKEQIKIAQLQKKGKTPVP